jgi:hypothetical protein
MIPTHLTRRQNTVQQADLSSHECGNRIHFDGSSDREKPMFREAWLSIESRQGGSAGRDHPAVGDVRGGWRRRQAPSGVTRWSRG